MGIENEQVSDVRTKIADDIALSPSSSLQGNPDDVTNYRFWGITASSNSVADEIKVVLEYRFKTTGQWREFDSFYIGQTGEENASVDRVYRVTREEYRARLENENEIEEPNVDLQYIKGGN